MRDDRGQHVQRNHHDDAASDAITPRYPRDLPRWHLAALIIIAAVATLALAQVVLVAYGVRGAFAASSVWPAMTVFIGACSALGVAIDTRKRFALAQAARRHQRCAACLYDLANLPPEDDGCTVCPECSAAWRLTDAQS